MFAKARENGVAGFIAFRSPLVAGFDKRVIELSNSYRIPGIFDARDFVDLGAFMSYGPNLQSVFRDLAPYVTRILKGDEPGALPIGQPRTLELVINKKAAKAFGLVVPPRLLTTANLVVE